MLIPPPKARVLHEGETVHLALRRHWLVLVGRALAPLVILSVPLVAFTYVLLARPSDATVLMQATVKVGLLALLIAGPWLWYNVYDWANDSFFITNRRVIHNERTFIWSENTIEASLTQIQNVTAVVPGPVANFFRFGSVTVETAAQVGSIGFDSVPDPFGVQRLLFELRGIQPPLQKSPRHLPTNLPDLLRYYFPIAPIRENGAVIYHKHWFVLLMETFVPAVLLVLSPVLALVAGTPLFLALLLIAVPYLWFQYANWVNDVYILTDSRIIDIYRIPLVREDRREALLAQIQNVQVAIPSLWGRIINMGNVLVETAGKATNFTFDSVENPRAVRDELAHRIDGLQARRRQQDDAARLEQTTRMVEEILDRYGFRPPPNGQPPTPSV